MKKKIIEPNIKGAYVRILLRMIDKPDPIIAKECHAALVHLDNIMKHVGLRTIINVSSEPWKKRK